VTYRELLELLTSVPEDRLGETVTVFDALEDEFFNVSEAEQNVDSDVLDEDHLFLTIKTPAAR